MEGNSVGEIKWSHTTRRLVLPCAMGNDWRLWRACHGLGRPSPGREDSGSARVGAGGEVGTRDTEEVELKSGDVERHLALTGASKGTTRRRCSGYKCLTCDWLTNNPILKPGSTTLDSLDSSACLSGRELCEWACCRKGIFSSLSICKLHRNSSETHRQWKSRRRRSFLFKKELAPSQIMSIKCPKTSYWTQNDNTDKKKKEKKRDIPPIEIILQFSLSCNE